MNFSENGGTACKHLESVLNLIQSDPFLETNALKPTSLFAHVSPQWLANEHLEKDLLRNKDMQNFATVSYHTGTLNRQFSSALSGELAARS